MCVCLVCCCCFFVGWLLVCFFVCFFVSLFVSFFLVLVVVDCGLFCGWLVKKNTLVQRHLQMAPATWLSPAVRQYSVVAAWLTSVGSLKWYLAMFAKQRLVEQNVQGTSHQPEFVVLMAGNDLMS